MFRTKDSNGNTKYVGSSKAVVLDNRDPLSKGRIIVDHPLLGNTVWIDYLRAPGIFTVPSVGDIVYVECDSGVYEFPFSWGNVTKGEDAAPEIPDMFKRTVPTNRGFYTPKGQSIELDDGVAKDGSDPKYDALTSKSRGIRITTSSGHKIHISDDPDNQVQSITILDKEGDGIVFDAQNKEVTLVSKGKMSLSSEADMSIASKAKISVAADADISVDGKANVNIKAASALEATGDTAKVSGSSMTTVGSSSSPTKVDGQEVTLAGGGPGVARLGDRAFGIGNLGAPVSSVIIQGSTKVKSG